MRLAASGMTDKEIAQATGLSLGTLRSHWDRMRARLGASSRGEVIARAAEEIRLLLANEVEILRHVLDAQGIFVWTANADGAVDYVNGWFEKFSGLPQEEILGHGCRVLMPAEQHGESETRWNEAQRRGAGYQAGVSFRSHDGRLVPHTIELNPLHVADGRVLRWVGMAREDKESLELPRASLKQAA